MHCRTPQGSQKAVAAAAEQVLDTTCVDGDPFTLEGYFDGSLDGCYSVLAENNGTTLPWYGLDGEADDDSSIVILPVSLSGGDVSLKLTYNALVREFALLRRKRYLFGEAFF